MMLFTLLFLAGVVFFWICLCSVPGYYIGRRRGNEDAGAALGTVLGPLGWVIILMLPDRRPRCRECAQFLGHSLAQHCPHCGAQVYSPLAAPERSGSVGDGGNDDEESPAPPKLIPVLGILVIGGILVYLVLRAGH